jgi:hypothetical protein
LASRVTTHLERVEFVVPEQGGGGRRAVGHKSGRSADALSLRQNIAGINHLGPARRLATFNGKVVFL